MIEFLSNWVLAHRKITTLGLLLVVLTMCAGAMQLRSDFSVEAFFGKGGPELATVHAFKDRWGRDDGDLLLILSAGETTLLAPDLLLALDQLANQIENLEEVSAVRSLPQTPPIIHAEPGLLNLEPLIDSLPGSTLDSPEFAQWQTSIQNHPTLVPALLSKDGSKTVFVLALSKNTDDIQALRPTVLALEEKVAELCKPLGFSPLLAGIPAVRAGFADLIFKDQLVAIPTIAIAILGLLFWLFRSAHGLFVPMLAAVIPAAMTFGLMGWTGEPIGLLNQVFATLLPAIAVADAIHMLARFHEELHRHLGPGETPSPELRKRAIAKAMSRVGTACFLTSTTTGIGFISLWMAEMPILNLFGLYAAVGIAFAYGTVLLIVPLALSLTSGPLPSHHRPESKNWSNRLVESSVDWSLKRPKSVLAITGLILLVSIHFGSQVIVDNVLTGLLAEDHPTTAANRIVDQELGGVISVEVDLHGAPGALKDPEIHRALKRFEDFARSLPEVRTVLSPTTYLQTLYRATRGKDGLPESPQGIAQLFLLGESDPQLQRILQVNDLSRGRVSVRVVDSGGNAYIEVASRLKEAVERELLGLPIQARVTGTPWVAYSGINRVTEDLRLSLGLAFVVIAFIILILFRSLRIALLCLIPNALPLVVGYALLGALDWPLDPTPAVVFTVALGIAVDDTIHLMARYREELQGGMGHNDAIRKSVLQTGRAVLITSIILCVGFGANAFSSFPSMRVMAGVGVASIFTALCCDLFLLPSLLSLFARPKEDGESPRV